ncbi:MAG: hypothetical protein JXR05_05370 [Flavobacteriaceae bacterium]
MLRKLLLFFLVLLSLKSISQNKQSIDSLYQKYFNLTRIIPHLHVNKTTFLQGEEVWFKAYVIDQNSTKLDGITSNLICTLHDENGNEVARKLVFVNKGIGHGSFLLDSIFDKKNYYLKASTNWMKNFKEDHSFMQKIKIVRSFNKKAKKIKVEYDIQILPEGGHLVEGVKSKVGLHIKNNNNEGIKIEDGIVLNSTGEKVGDFKTNIFGHGKFDLNYRNGEKYRIEFNQNEEKISKDIPLAETKGYTLNISNSNKEHVRVLVKTNYLTLTKTQGKVLKVLVHNTRFYLSEKIQLKPNFREYNLFIKRDSLKNGMNMITLFDHLDRPVSERIFFNYSRNLFETVSVEKSAIKNDSITFTIQKKGLKKSAYYLSASFLPESTKAYNPDQNIYSSFLLKPYVRGRIQNASYYFKNTTPEKLKELDLLLVNQGWSKYKWDNIFNNSPKPVHENNRGVTLKGKLNLSEKKLKGRLSLASPKNNLYESKKIYNPDYQFKHLLLKENSIVVFSYKKKHREIKPKGAIRFIPSLVKETAQITKYKETEQIEDTTSINIDNFLTKRELLNEVKLKAQVTFNNKPLSTLGYVKGIKVSDYYSDYVNLLDIINGNGFLVDGISVPMDNTNDNLIIYERQHYNIRNALVRSGGPRPVPARIFLDDLEITSSARQLLYIKADNIDEVFFNRTQSGTIFVYTKNKVDLSSIRQTTTNYLVPYGFATEKEYYSPNYSSYLSNIFKKYGALYWEPKIRLTENANSFQIKVPVHYQNSMNIFLEGITSGGKLIQLNKGFTIK